MSAMRKRVVVLHSGGLDSTVCVELAVREESEVVSLGIDYGQRHQIELAYARAQCDRLGIERRVISVSWDKPQRPLPTDRTVGEIKARGVSPAFLPGRNGVLLMLACAEAAGLDATEVWTGINSVDFSGYPDCRPEFVRAFSQMLELAIPNGPEVKAPLQNFSKPQIAALARSFGMGPGDTWSCYRPKIHAGGISPCGKCDACVLHEYGWAHASSADVSQT